MTMWTSLPSCLTMLYIDGEYQFGVSAGCCCERSAPKTFSPGAVAALRVHVPGIGVIAAADDAVVADDVVDLGVRRDDRQAVDLTLVSHVRSSLQSTLDRRP